MRIWLTLFGAAVLGLAACSVLTGILLEADLAAPPDLGCVKASMATAPGVSPGAISETMAARGSLVRGQWNETTVRFQYTFDQGEGYLAVSSHSDIKRRALKIASGKVQHFANAHQSAGLDQENLAKVRALMEGVQRHVGETCAIPELLGPLVVRFCRLDRPHSGGHISC